jgi:hypothetical protein
VFSTTRRLLVSTKVGDPISASGAGASKLTLPSGRGDLTSRRGGVELGLGSEEVVFEEENSPSHSKREVRDEALSVSSMPGSLLNR